MAAAPLSNMRSFKLEAPCARVFPLFTAEGEKAWAPGWNPEMLSGDTARGSVFRTENHEHETVWIVVDYQPALYRAAYARIAQGSNMGLVDVICRGQPGGSSEVSVRYTLTGLNDEGAAFVRKFLSDAHYTHFIGEWHTALSAVLKKRSK